MTDYMSDTFDEVRALFETTAAIPTALELGAGWGRRAKLTNASRATQDAAKVRMLPCNTKSPNPPTLVKKLITNFVF